MTVSKHFLVQLQVELEIDPEGIHEQQAVEYIRTHLSFDSSIQLHGLTVYELTGRPNSESPPPESVRLGAQRDVIVEEYEYKDYFAVVYRAASTVGSVYPRYFGVARKKTTKTTGGSVVKDSDSHLIKGTKAAIEAFIDRKMARQKS